MSSIPTRFIWFDITSRVTSISWTLTLSSQGTTELASDSLCVPMSQDQLQRDVYCCQATQQQSSRRLVFFSTIHFLWAQFQCETGFGTVAGVHVNAQFFWKVPKLPLRKSQSPSENASFWCLCSYCFVLRIDFDTLSTLPPLLPLSVSTADGLNTSRKKICNSVKLCASCFPIVRLYFGAEMALKRRCFHFHLLKPTKVWTSGTA